MKPLACIIISLFVFVSCKKEVTPFGSDPFLSKAKAFLQDSMLPADYSELDFSKALINKVDSLRLYFIRVPFKGNSVSNDFVIVRISGNEKQLSGKIISLKGAVVEVGGSRVKRREWEGNVSMSSLNRRIIIRSAVHHGYIDALHVHTNLRQQTLEPVYPDNTLPEVVVVAYVNNIPDFSFSTWFLLSSFFYSVETGSGSSGAEGYYGSMDGGGYGYGGGGGGYYGDPGTGVVVDQTILIDADTYADNESIDIEQYLKCFDAIPDAGAQCEIGIYADIPVDSDPNKLFDFNTGSPGHTFIGIKKTNGAQTTLQYIGFYPKNGWKTAITNAPMDGKFVNNGGHEYNASYTKTLTTEEFKSTLTEIRYLKNVQYDIDNFNCTDWALNIFNKQGYGLQIPLYDVPGSVPSVGTSTPQGVYNKLMEMKTNNAEHSNFISIGFLKGWVANGTGPCY